MRHLLENRLRVSYPLNYNPQYWIYKIETIPQLTATTSEVPQGANCKLADNVVVILVWLNDNNIKEESYWSGELPFPANLGFDLKPQQLCP